MKQKPRKSKAGKVARGLSPGAGRDRATCATAVFDRRNAPAVLFARAAWAVALLATAAAVVLHVVFLRNAGGLWRDEASTVYLATLPTLADVWRWLPYDHCPPVIHMAIRGWWALGLAGTDFSLRVLGLLLGLLLPAACWTSARLMRNGVPLVALALVAVNPTIISVGDSFRGYGVGAVCAILVVAFTWRAARRTTKVNLLLAACVAVLSVQCLYQNAAFVLAACTGAAAVCLLERRHRDVLPVLAIGLVAAVSLAPYVGIVRRAQDWYALEKSGFTFALGWTSLSGAIGFPLPAFSIVWGLLCGIALIAMVAGMRSLVTGREDHPGEGALFVFAGVALVVGVVTFVLFLKAADLPTTPSYYVPLMTFVAVVLDGMLVVRRRLPRAVVLALVLVTVVAATPLAMPSLDLSQTDVDTLARRLTQDGAADDYIIVHPWYCGATFARYYRGAAQWSTLPQLSDHFLHRYDLLKVEMQKANPIQPVLERIAATLQAGHRVWIVGAIPLGGEQPLTARPAPNNEWGWWDEPYSMIWAGQAGYFMATRAMRGGVVLDSSVGVNPRENLPLILVSGWR